MWSSCEKSILNILRKWQMVALGSCPNGCWNYHIVGFNDIRVPQNYYRSFLPRNDMSCNLQWGLARWQIGLIIGGEEVVDAKTGTGRLWGGIRKSVLGTKINLDWRGRPPSFYGGGFRWAHGSYINLLLPYHYVGYPCTLFPSDLHWGGGAARLVGLVCCSEENMIVIMATLVLNWMVEIWSGSKVFCLSSFISVGRWIWASTSQSPVRHAICWWLWIMWENWFGILCRLGLWESELKQGRRSSMNS